MIKKSGIFALLLTFLCLLFPISCKKPTSENPRIFRLIDQFTQDNIQTSPLLNLKTRFEMAAEDLTGKWRPVKKLSGPTQKTWASPTANRILANSESEKPAGMNLKKDGQELNFFADGEEQPIFWRWSQGSKIIPAIELRNYKRKLSCSVITPRKPIEFSRLLPGGSVELEIEVRKGKKTPNNGRLSLFLDKHLIKTVEVNSENFSIIRIKTETKLKNTAVRLTSSQQELHVKTVSIKTEFDLVLMTIRSENAQIPIESNFQVVYPAHKLKAGHDSGYSEKYLLSLLTTDSLPPIHDLGVASEPTSIKKKLVFEDVALNSLLAPPLSEFNFELIVPDDSMLEFGCGILETEGGAKTSGVDFQIMLQQEGVEQKLFSASLNPAVRPEDKNLLRQNLDLSEYAGKRIELTFITSLPVQGESGTSAPAPLAFWFNPAVIRSASAQELNQNEAINIVLISIDTLRPDRLGCYGYIRNTSPGIDQLAADGVMFHNCFAQSNWTLPSHVSMLTSLNSYNHQVYLAHEKMSPSLITVADILRQHDFYCGGITGGGYVSEKFGFSKGFDDYKGERFVFHALDEAEKLRDASLEWLDNNSNRKFFLFLHTYQVHDPYYNHPGITEDFAEGKLTWDTMPISSFLRNQPEKRKYPFTDKEIADINALYDGEIKYTDVFLIQPLLQKLKELDLYDRTMIIFISDHGEEFKDHNSWLHAHSLYNELIKVPLIIKYPQSLHKGKQVDIIVRSIDLVPTILSAAGINTEPFNFDGVDLDPVTKGKEKANRTFIADFSHKGSSELRPTMVATNQDFSKLIVNRKPKQPKMMLFDLQNDPSETKNLEKDNPGIVRTLFQNIVDFYNNFKEIALKSEQVKMDKALEERLKALGYIH